MFILSARDGEAHEGITGISLEIHAHIQSFIEPSDIISLRQTCRYLYDATHQREVWKSVLRRVCISQGLFMPSFPMEQMSMEELENAALGPLRFSSMLTSRNPDSLPKPHKTRIIEFRSATAGKFGEFQRFDFIPGGRYLITQCDHALLFWDLGANISVNRTLPLNPIASLPIDTAFKVSGFGCGPTTDGLGILLFVVKDPTTAYQRTSDVSVHVIHPLSSNPEFVHVASLNGIRFRQLRWAWTDSLFVFSTYPSGYVTVWNFKDDSILSWDHKFPQVFDIAVCEGHIIIYQPDSFSLELGLGQRCSDLE
ncbi:hypothetical protein FPV67DRAFT_199842 [Lyophyllum atratum]|nr:hypothetical protein FPV67DRAFT_199842 [Lyophyllum atratum]